MLATHEMFSLQLRLLVSQEERMRAVKNRLWFWSVLCLRGIELPRTWKRLKTLTSLILRKKLKSPKKMRLKMQIPKVKRQRMSSRNHLKQLLEKKQLQEKIQNKMRRQNLGREKEMERKQRKSKKRQSRMRSHQHQSLRKERSICITHSQRETMPRGLPPKSMLLSKKLKILYWISKKKTWRHMLSQQVFSMGREKQSSTPTLRRHGYKIHKNFQ